MVLPLFFYINFRYSSLRDDAWRIVEKTCTIKLSDEQQKGCGRDYWTLAVDNMSRGMMWRSGQVAGWRNALGCLAVGPASAWEATHDGAPSAGNLCTVHSITAVEVVERL